MNERIKELYEQSLTHTTGKDHAGNPMAIIKQNPEKFAELIVLACYEHCKGEMLDEEVAGTHELTYNDAVMDCAVGLLQHFRIEL